MAPIVAQILAAAARREAELAAIAHLDFDPED